MRPRQQHFGIYLLPNLFTTASLFAAFYAIVAGMKGHYETAAIAIFFGMIADLLDGRIARLTNTQTAFGAEYDSLSDMVTFGVAPSLLAYSYFLHQFGKIGWLIAFMYTAAVALRLARFNTQLETADKHYFQGLACPAAAAIVAAFIWNCYKQHLHHGFFALILACLMIALALLMVSNIRYHNFKHIDLKGRIPFLYLLFIVVLFVAIAANPSVVLLISFLCYALLGPIHTLIRLQQVRKKHRKA